MNLVHLSFLQCMYCLSVVYHLVVSLYIIDVSLPKCKFKCSLSLASYRLTVGVLLKVVMMLMLQI